MSILRPKFSLRYSLIFVTVLVLLVAWLGDRWHQHVRRAKAYQSLVECDVGMRGMKFPSKLFVDAANELRKLSHADAVAVIRRFEEQEQFKNNLAIRIVYPLAFEPTVGCPEERQYYFNIDKSYPGFLCLREGIPFELGLQSFSWSGEESRSRVLDRWGKVRPGFLPTKSSDWYDWQRKLIPYLDRDWEFLGESHKKFVASMGQLGFDGPNDKKIAVLRTYSDGKKLATGRVYRSHIVSVAKALNIDLSDENLDEWGVEELQ